MTTCPTEVQRYLDEHWEDVEPFEEPATIQGNDFSLLNVWACWYDEHGHFHALDCTDGTVTGYVFTGAYLIKYEAPHESVDGNVVRAMDFSFEAPS